MPDHSLPRNAFTPLQVYAGKLSDGTDVAVKIIDRKKFKSEQDLKDMRAEVDMMTRVRGHPNVVNFIGHVEDKDRFVIVLERATGGEVMTRITQLVDAGLRFSEKVASQMFKQMLAAVKHCHDKVRPALSCYVPVAEAHAKYGGDAIQCTCSIRRRDACP